MQHLSRPLASPLAVFNSQQESAGVIDPEGQEKQLINVRNK